MDTINKLLTMDFDSDIKLNQNNSVYGHILYHIIKMLHAKMYWIGPSHTP